jgi:hypothetical protein
MPTLEDYATRPGWKIKSWGVDRSGKVPTHAMTVYGGLVIGITSPETCTVTWLDGDQRLCSITGLPFQPATGYLEASDFPVSFGESGIVVCRVLIFLDEKGEIAGHLEARGDNGIDGNTGTFAAEGHPGPPSDEPS